MKQRLLWLLALEVLIAVAMTARCYTLAGCQDALCVPVGNSISLTCLSLGLKVFGALAGSTLIVAFLMARDRR